MYEPTEISNQAYKFNLRRSQSYPYLQVLVCVINVSELNPKSDGIWIERPLRAFHARLSK